MDRSPATGDDERPMGEVNAAMEDVLAALGHPLRREVLRYCVEQSTRDTDLYSLTDHLVAEGRHDERERVALLLHHLHLPKLADMGLVEFDPKSGQVRYHPSDELEQLIGRIHGEV